ncbi:DUF4012 domain-containing protein [Demequina rhizosphaerae]|uniref:DUF4012 domain-containing protein n=1 Tax=Demequina rhizosphaerae TaxID=1638985 RepID=UPI000780D842|nr:DUF4012 domain-containing protein [Demequina rhizosphaerae]
MGDDAVVEPPRRRRWPWVVAGAVLVAVGVVAALFAYDGMRLQSAADGLTAHAAAARQALEARDVEALQAEVASLEDAANVFGAATHGPHWWLASHVPWVKEQARPLIAAGDAVGAVAHDALEPLAGLEDLDALAGPAFEGGRIDPEMLEPYRPALEQASGALDGQVEALAAIDLARTVDQVREPFEDLEEQLESLAAMVDGARVTAELLPTMLGGDGPRTYLVVVQNNAEPRTTGGLPGAFLELTVDDGDMSLGAYDAARSLVVDDGVAELTADEERIFSELMAVYPHDANFTPEFPRTAELLSAFWEHEHGTVVDGVVSVDPVALGWMLEGAPALETEGLTITGANLADVLLNQAYFLYDDPLDQDQFFVRTARDLFGRIVSGKASPVAGVQRAIDAHRFLLWSAHGDEEEVLAGTPVSGTFLEEDDALGVFLNDGSGSKIGYYVETNVTVVNMMCADGSLASQVLQLDLAHTFGGDVADLPYYVSGGGVFVPEGQFQANVVVYPVVGTEVVSTRLDGEPTEIVADTHDGRAMSQKRVTLDPGESVRLTYEFAAKKTGLGDPGVVVTPGPRDMPPTVLTEQAAGC